MTGHLRRGGGRMRSRSPSAGAPTLKSWSMMWLHWITSCSYLFVW